MSIFRSVPSQHLIEGVPFIGWAEAARLEYPDRGIVNPSAAAAAGMVLKYWEEEPARSLPFAGSIPIASVSWDRASNFRKLRKLIARDVPVIVSAGLTPRGHPIQPMFVPLATLSAASARSFSYTCVGAVLDTVSVTSGVGHQAAGELGGNPYAGMLGIMASYEVFANLQARPWTGVNLLETLYLAVRVLIGYDDSTRVVTLHDPSLGPAWEISYEDFERMWAPQGRLYEVMHPPHYEQLLTRERPSDPYRRRAANERAGEQLLFGYAHSCVGCESDFSKAEEYFARGLAIPGIGVGYEHLFLLEQATIHSRRSDYSRAIELLERAIALLPQHHLPWQVLAEIYEHGLSKGDKARSARAKVSQLWEDSGARQLVAETLPCDFWIQNLAPTRRWCF